MTTLNKTEYDTVTKEIRSMELGPALRYLDRVKAGRLGIKPGDEGFAEALQAMEFVIEQKRQDARDDFVGFARAIAQGVTFGFADEMEAGVRSLNPFGDDYATIRDDIRAQDRAFTERNPGMGTVAEIGGGMAVPGLGMYKLAQMALPGKSLLPRLASSSAIGGAEGFVSGYGQSEADTTLGQLSDAGLAMLEGATLNPILSEGFPLLKNVSGNVLRNVMMSPDQRAKTKIADAMGSEELEPLAGDPSVAMLADRSETLAGMLGGAGTRNAEAQTLLVNQLGKRQEGALGRISDTMDDAYGYSPRTAEARNRADEAERARLVNAETDLFKTTVMPTAELTNHLAENKRIRRYVKQAMDDYSDQQRMQGDGFAGFVGQDRFDITDAEIDATDRVGKTRQWFEENQPPLEFYEGIRKAIREEVADKTAKGKGDTIRPLNVGLNKLLELIDDQIPEYRKLRKELSQVRTVQSGFELGRGFKPDKQQTSLDSITAKLNDEEAIRTQLQGFNLSDDEIREIIEQRKDRFRAGARLAQDDVLKSKMTGSNLGTLQASEKRREVIEAGTLPNRSEEVIGALSQEGQMARTRNLSTPSLGSRTRMLEGSAESIDVFEDIKRELTNNVDDQTALSMVNILRRQGITDADIEEIRSNRTIPRRLFGKIETISALSGFSTPFINTLLIGSTVTEDEALDPEVKAIQAERNVPYRMYKERAQ